MLLVPTALALISGSMSWHDAVPLLVAGVIGLAWPENIALQNDAQTFVTDVADLMLMCMDPGKSAPQSAPQSAPISPPGASG